MLELKFEVTAKDDPSSLAHQQVQHEAATSRDAGGEEKQTTPESYPIVYVAKTCCRTPERVFGMLLKSALETLYELHYSKNVEKMIDPDYFPYVKDEWRKGRGKGKGKDEAKNPGRFQHQTSPDAQLTESTLLDELAPPP